MLETALKILKKIESNSYEAYIVGGFVRDYLMGVKSNDVDITTNARPKELIEIFPNANIDNAMYGSVTVYCNDVKFEITTYRTEIDYDDSRHPATVNYIDNLKTDLKRRDFTINTICMDKEGKIIDLLSCKDDIDKKVIKTVSDPFISFKTDCLRILRAIRFATTLDFTLSEDLMEAIRQTKYLLKDLSINRKKEELDKIFSSSNIEKGLQLIKTLGLKDVLYLDRINQVKKCRQVIGVWTLLMVDDIYPFTRNELQLMKNIREVMKDGPLNKNNLYYYDLYVCSVAAEIMGISNKKVIDVYKTMPIYKRSDILIDSYDIMDCLNIEEGPILSKIWERLENEIINNQVINEKKQLLLAVKKIYTSLLLSGEESDETKTAN